MADKEYKTKDFICVDLNGYWKPRVRREECDELKNDENSCHLTFSNVRTSPVSGTPFLLSNISGEVRPGEVLAVMGQTGSGKTSLLNALSGRLPVQGGKIRLNGEDLCKRLRRSKIGYVLQHDVFFADLTLKQTLVYTALLRLPDRKFTKAEKLEKVEEIIDTLDLRRCQDTIIGDVMKRGLSGGEKKRLSIACELITNPSVLLIDEPTSGLDSCTASHLMIMLKDYALKESKSVVLAVHQPSSKIFHLFDRLLLLADGQTAYFGQSSHVISHFSALGLHIVPHYNPADFVLEQLKNEKVKILAAWKNKNTSGYPYIQNGGVISSGEKKQELNEDYNGNEMLRHSSDSSLSTWPTSFVTQTRVLAARNFREQLPKMLSAFNWFQTITLAVMAGLTWFKTERNEESLSDLEGFMFFTTNYWMLFALFTPLSTFPSERAVIEKERLSGAYRLSAYYVAKMIGEAPLVVVLPSVYLAVAYPLRGGSVVPFFGLLFVQMLASLAAQSVGLFFGAALNPSASITASALFTLAAQLLGGYLAKTIPPYTKTLSLVYHGYRNMQIFEYLVGDQIVCAKQASEYPACPSFVGTAGRTLLSGLQNGTAAVIGSTNLTATTTETFIPTQDLLGKDDLTWLPYWSSTVFLIAFFIFFRVLGYIALRRSL